MIQIARHEAAKGETDHTETGATARRASAMASLAIVRQSANGLRVHLVATAKTLANVRRSANGLRVHLVATAALATVPPAAKAALASVRLAATAALATVRLAATAALATVRRVATAALATVHLAAMAALATVHRAMMRGVGCFGVTGRKIQTKVSRCVVRAWWSSVVPSIRCTVRILSWRAGFWTRTTAMRLCSCPPSSLR